MRQYMTRVEPVGRTPSIFSSRSGHQVLSGAACLALIVGISLSYPTWCDAEPGAADGKQSAAGLSDADEQDMPAPVSSVVPSKPTLEGTVTRSKLGSDTAGPTGEESTRADRLNAIITKTDNSPWERYNRLGKESFEKYNYSEAVKNFVLAIRELKKTNLKDERLVESRNNLGETYLADSKFMDAEEAFEAARQTEQDLHMIEGPQIGRTLRGMAKVYQATDKPAKAEQAYKDAIQTRQSSLGPNHPSVADGLVDLAELYRKRKLYTEAEPAYRLAVETYDKSPNVTVKKKADVLEKFGRLYYDQGKLDEASKLAAASLAFKDQLSTLYAKTDPRNLGLVYYQCLDGNPNSYHTFTRGMETEMINVKDASVVATLTAQIFDQDWYLLKAQVTVQNQGKEPISALPMPPTLKIESPKAKAYTPLDSDAIAGELQRRGKAAFDSLLHSADYKYINDSILGTPFGTYSHYSPDWQARREARNKAMTALASSMQSSSSVTRYKPGETTIAPGQTQTFVIYFPYVKFDACVLRIVLGNAVLEFPFTSKSG